MAYLPQRLRLVRSAAPHSGAADDARFLFEGNVAAPVEAIILDPDVALPPPALPRPGRPFRLHVLHINDLHGRISQLELPGSPPILSRIAGRIQELRQRCQVDPNSAVLMLSAGDELAGSVFDDVAFGDIAHPVYHLYGPMGMDAVVLGNHDFDLGPARLAAAIRHHTHFPVLCANLAPFPELEELVHPAALLVVKGVRVGIVGVTTPAQPQGRPDIRLLDPVQTLHNIIPALQPLCDVLIVLSHLGLRLGSNSAGVVLAGDVELAESLPRGAVHLIVGGHTHHALNNDGLEADNIVNGIPMVQAGSIGRFLGEATISINGAAALTDARLVPVQDLLVDDTFEAEAVLPLLEKARRHLQRSLGRVDSHSDLSTEAVRNDFALGESALANFICDGLLARCRAHSYLVDLAMIDSSVVRCGLPAHDSLTLGDWFKVMPFADTIRLYRLSGLDLRRLLLDNARRAGRPDEPHTERGFLHFSRQVRYLIEPGASRRSASVQMVTVNGAPLEWQPEHVYTVACPSFVRQLAGPWERRAAADLGFLPLSLQRWTAVDTGLFLRQELLAYIEQAGGVTGAAGVQRDGRVRVLWSTLVALQSHIDSTEKTQRAPGIS